MIYSNLDEVWNTSDIHPDIYKNRIKHMNNTKMTSNCVNNIQPEEKFFIEGFKDYEDSEMATQINEISSSTQKNENKNKDENKEDILYKLITNKKMRKEFENKYKVKIIDDNITTTWLTDQNKEILCIFLMGFFIILILDLFIQIGKIIPRK